jgi:hypothetical protein
LEADGRPADRVPIISDFSYSLNDLFDWDPIFYRPQVCDMPHFIGQMPEFALRQGRPPPQILSLKQ